MNSTEKFRKTKKGILTNCYSKQKQRKGVEYSLEDLHIKFLTDAKFDRLYKEWIKSNYNKEFKPTIDRINCKEIYTMKNIQCISWKDNRYKQRMETNIFRSKKIVCIKENKVVNIFSSVSNAVRKTGLMQGNISACLTKRRKTCGGYKWIYFTDEVIGNIHES
jgi:hypothetical protein